MIKIAICDDEKMIVEEIEKILKCKNISLDEDLIIEKFFSGVELFSTLENSGYFDLIFLDIEMPGLTGLELSQKLRYNLNDKKTQIVFVSAKDKYMKAMFDVAPLKFIQKNQTPQSRGDGTSGSLFLKNRKNSTVELSLSQFISRSENLKNDFIFEKQ